MDNNIIYTGNTRYSIYDNDKRRKIGDKYVPYDKKIEYIETDGTQWIDTGIYPNSSTTSVELDISFHGTFKTRGGIIFNSTGTAEINNTTTNIVYSCNFGASSSQGNTIFTWFGKTYETGGAIRHMNSVPLTRGVLSYDASTGKFSYNGKSVTVQKIDAVRTSTLKILPNFKAYNARIYGLIIRENNTIIMDLIPVRVDNVGYLYDRISKQLFHNSGTGNFILGLDIEHSYTKPYDSEIAYLRGTGGLINLGIYLDSKAYVELKFSSSTYTYRPYGGINNNNVDFSMKCVDSNLRFYYNTTSSAAYKMPQPNTNQVFTSIQDGNNYTLYNSSGTVLLTGSFTAVNFDLLYPCYLFAYNNKGSVGGLSMLIRHCIIKNKDKVFDFIPVRIGTTGYIYDKISGKLFAGTGSFTLGPDVISN